MENYHQSLGELTNYYVVDKHIYLMLCMPFLYFKFLFILWIQLSFCLNCGIYINFWFAGIYITILSFIIILIINIKYKIKYKLEYITFLFSLIWMLLGIYMNNGLYTECSDNKIILSTFIVYLLSSSMFTFVITTNKNH